ncbi:MAG: GNAT family N-acetyltransferase [Anaerolineae bacterium]
MDVRRIEEAALNAWPAKQQRLYDGWLLRFSEGYSKRANSVNPLYASTLDVETKIDVCEAQYAAKALPTLFRITPLASPADLDQRLAARGYRVLDPTRVEVLDLATWSAAGTSPSALEDLSLDAWRERYATFAGRRLPAAHHAMLEAIAGGLRLVCLRHAGRPVACGMAVVEGAYVGLFSLITDPVLRRRGYGQALVESLLDRAKGAGARHAYLQVQESNGPARQLYAKLGFRELYRYWYRRAPEDTPS